MIAIPKTSVALLNAIAASPDSSRWTEFYDRYQPVIASYLQSKFAAANPPLEIDDIIQNTMIAFMKKLPTYRPPTISARRYKSHGSDNSRRTGNG